MGIKDYLENVRKERERAERRESAIKVAYGLTIGAALGAVGGLLFAPKPGKETREEIATKAREKAESTKETLAEKKEAMAEKKEELRGKYEEIKEKRQTGEESPEEVEDTSTL
ncbi:MAG: YtxH domain-containing protein [Candidatus Syntrophonatronum acetioxidans]|uniref:YtxH domain-containing protein n=1 Tax=Candidatus Syntrophonatronum acetioxidans TaxID=1795816 RepID=A0A424YC46_9FIRM|nr:MAG: YtxH domain-containing protein [Candidatus Syntrophonatronum acetioxidans]